MLSYPWDVVLTILFAATGLWCAVDLVAGRARSRSADGSLTEHTVIHVNHLVMSAAMILMIWVTVIEVVTWAQAVLFAVFVLALLPAALTADRVRRRVSLWGHVVMNAAMIWMLLAMPLLMAGMVTDEGDSSGHHHGGDASAMPTSTPVGVDAANVLFVVLSSAAALWWVVPLLRRRGRHLHDLCYAGMAAGMAVMLVLMNA